MFTAVTLRKNLARSLRRGHPWIYRDALEPAAAISAGALVRVETRDGRPLGFGFWDATSPIAVRMLGDRAPDGTLVRERLHTALARRLARLDRRETNAFRWVHGEADLLPGIHVDLYDDMAVVRHDGDGSRTFYRTLETDLRAAAQPLALAAVIDREHRSSMPERVVRENGLSFAVDLARGQKGGLFLDQRDNRQAVRGLAGGRSVLNLFGYTGGFSVYAAAGGAGRTDTVDIAAPALEAARRNFALNDLPSDRAGFFAEDAFAFLERATKRRQSWDLVISDPPSFAPRKSVLPAARRAYRRLHRMAAAVTAPGGIFCPASCSSHFSRDEFVASVHAGAADAGRRFTLLELRGAGFDHPVLPAFPEGDYLKFAMGRLD